MADPGGECLGFQKSAGQDEAMADTVFKRVKSKAIGYFWW